MCRGRDKKLSLITNIVLWYLILTNQSLSITLNEPVPMVYFLDI